MSIEADPCAGPGSWRKGRRLAYVVKQHAPSESGRAIWRKPLQHHSRVNPNISLGMKLRRLLDALHARDVGEHHGKQARFVEQLKSTLRGAFGQQFCQLFA